MSSRDITRAMPDAPELEKGVLSCMMQAPEYAVAKATEILKPAHFHKPANRLLFELLTELHREGTPIDPVTIQQVLMDRNQMVMVGGPAFTAEIYTFAPTPAHVSHYAAQVRDKSTLRRVIEACEASMNEAFSRPEDAGEILSRAEARILAVREGERSGSRTVGGKQALFQVIDAIEFQMNNKIPMGTPSGLRDFDEKTGGIVPGLILIGGEPSGGKSVVAMAWLIALLRAGKRCRYYSLEMTCDIAMRRILSHLSGIALNRLINPIPALDDREMSQLQRAAKDFGEMGHLLTVNDDGGMTASAIMADCRQAHASAPLGAVVVDYVQRLAPEDAKATPEQQISTSSRMLKRLADALSIPVVSPVQLNENDAVRGSRMLGMDADVFVRIKHGRDRDGQPYEPDAWGRRGCVLWVEKVRNGPRWFVIPCVLDGRRMTFSEGTL